MNYQNKNIWDIETSALMNPEELLVYYLYKYDTDKTAKKDRFTKEDAYFIRKYAILLGLIKEENDDDVHEGNV